MSKSYTKKELKIYILKYFILIVIFFSIIKSTDFFSKVYFIGTQDYKERISRNYSFCKNGSIPFLQFLKVKYNLNKKVKIIDYDINPNSEWVLFNLNNDNIYKDKLILLNYRKEEQMQFIKIKPNLFINYTKPPHFFTIKKAIFSTNHNINNINLEISNRVGNVKEILLSKNFIFNSQFREIDLNLDLEKFNIRLGKLFIEVSNSENNLEDINKIDLKIVSNYDLDNFRVLERKDNCYFLEKLS